jgi:5-oxoprolinase (ATP-hydrolysing)
MSAGFQVGVDIGGTFTDFVLLNTATGGVRVHKRLTTPADPSQATLEGLDVLLGEASLNLSHIDRIVHGTTLVANAIIEHRGAKTAMLTTRGFRDILEMGREQRYHIYDLFLKFPDPLVPRELRYEIDERMSRDGDAVRALDLEQARAAVQELTSKGIESLAICLLHSYRNPVHEDLIAALVRREFPDLFLSVSSEVVAELREYERTSTTVANAFVQPLMNRYLRRLEDALGQKGFRGQFLLMQSSGGLVSTDTAREFPIRLLESGPAGGAMVGAFFGRQMGLDDLLALDMGGTTAKSCLIRGGKPELVADIEAARVSRFMKGSGLPIRVPVLDLIEIGAGGGSIAHRNDLGLLQVGPQSAGAEPGPACYALGGTSPTVTDACLVLGYLDPDYFLGGEMTLDRGLALNALARLAVELGISDTAAAWGVHAIVCDNMASSARTHIIEKGYDPRRFPIIAFGGAGPLHATRVARALGSSEVVVPRGSGVASSLGFLVSPVSFEYSRSLPDKLASIDWQQVNRMYDELSALAVATLKAAEVDPHAIQFARRAEMRLAGQFHDIEVSVPAGALTSDSADTLTSAFQGEYERRYHAVLPGYEVMVLNWRLRAEGPEPELKLNGADFAESNSIEAGQSSTSSGRAQKGARSAYFPEADGFVTTPVYDRYLLRSGDRLTGPAIVEEKESTTVVGPGDKVLVDRNGNLRITVDWR